MALDLVLAALAFLSVALLLWQFTAACRFPLHKRVADHSFTPAVTLLKPLKGCDAEMWHCLESWIQQDYPAPVQILFGVASHDDPACEIVRSRMAAHPQCDAQLIICSESLGPNAKVSTLVQLQPHAKHDVSIVSDADVRVPPDLLLNVVAPLRDPAVGLVNCFYRLANPTTLPMQWEAIAINSDFWSQVCQARTLRPMDFALGAVMATTRKQLGAIGGLESLVDYLADDYQLGNKIARAGGRIELCPVVVDCLESPKTWTEIWKHQLRWARTIRVCQPLPWFFSILSNATLWPLLWFLFASPGPAFEWSKHFDGTFQTGAPTLSSVVVTAQIPWTLVLVLICLALRIAIALCLQRRLTRSFKLCFFCWLAPIKDLLGAAIWLFSFLGNHVQWRGERYRVLRAGKLTRCR